MTIKSAILILAHGAGCLQVHFNNDPALSGEQYCMDHLYWNTIHLLAFETSKQLCSKYMY